MIAHVAGLPIEELLPLASGGSTALLLARAWIASVRDAAGAEVHDGRRHGARAVGGDEGRRVGDLGQGR
jgi:hypothetical protein